MKIPQSVPQLPALLSSIQNPNRLLELVDKKIGPTDNGKYRHWETVKRLSPPDGLTVDEHWLAIKLARQFMRREIPTFVDKANRPFWYAVPDPIWKMLHALDRRSSGNSTATSGPILKEQGQRFIQQSLMEEAITSSQLEGASTTRKVAKEMIRSGRKPVNSSERMILNNFLAMRKVATLVKQPLTSKLIEDIHSTLTDQTEPERIGFRQPNDGIKIFDNSTGTEFFDPPHAAEIPQRLKALCDFVNGDEGSEFLHPAVKAIIVHFWFAYIHPFQDGNGRTARALFYWYLLKHGFWLIEFVSISRILKKAPARYGKSFLYTESDDNDLTYFILSQLRVLERSVEDLEAYLIRKSDELADLSAYLRPGSGFNHRQLALISHALKNSSQVYTFKSHATSHGITYQTARTDLLELSERGLFDLQKQGREFLFRPSKDIGAKLKALKQ